MEIILIQDVKSLGKKGDKVNVSEGYARNFLLPKKLGLEATPKNLNDLKLTKAKEAKLAQEELEAARELKTRIEGQQVKLSIKSGKDGRSFGSVSAKEIAEGFKAQTGIEVDKKKMKLDEAIKAPGVYMIAVRLHKEVTAQLKVVVEGSV
jgi:large subunit ribosomal protein L9